MKLTKLQRLYEQAGRYKERAARLRHGLTFASPGCEYHYYTNRKLKEAKRQYKRAIRLALKEEDRAPYYIMRDVFSDRLFLLQNGSCLHTFYWGDGERYETMEEAYHAAQETIFAYLKLPVYRLSGRDPVTK